MSSARIYVWGSGGSGQLGLGDSEDYALPQRLQSASELELRPHSITTGGCHSAAVDAAGELYLWGDNEKQQLARLRGDVSVIVPTRQAHPAISNGFSVGLVACGWSHTVAVVQPDGPGCPSVLTWGANDHHQLGRVTTDSPTSNPSAITFQGIPSPLRRVVCSLSCGWKHSMLALDDGSVYSWGTGRQGELGLGTDQKTALQPTLLRQVQADRVYCGWQHSVVHHSQAGTIYACGSNRHGQLGVSKELEPKRFTLQRVGLAANMEIAARQVDVGWHFVLCVTRDNGDLYAWGKGAHGQLGHGDMASAVDKPTFIRFREDVRAIACGSEHSLVLTTSGDLYTCGWGEHGNLGHGDHKNLGELTRVQFFTDIHERVESITAAGAVSIAVTSYTVMY